jgi:prepilin-type N-terminal cleavage/methylation domain-containing protein
MKGDKGFAFIETVVAVALLGIVAVIFLGSIGTSTSATVVSDEQATAESLARSEAEYIKSCAYQSSYQLDPVLDIPVGWSVLEPAVEVLDVGLQKVTITVQRDGEEKLSVMMYKVDR